MEHLITAVETDSIAYNEGIEPGDYLVAVNKQDIIDVIDYIQACAKTNLELRIKDHKTNITHDIKVVNDGYEGLGLEFENYLMSSQRTCANKCVFCFEDQLPLYARDSLKAKDDDWRLSFIMGNYVTLTNVGKNELARIILRKVSPLYISVHAVGKLRQLMLNNPNAHNIISQLEQLAQGKISFHCQIVLCPGINDDVELKKTLDALYLLHPFALTVAVVPVGLTAHRQGLFALRNVTKDDACNAINIVNQMRKKSMEERGTGFAYVSDEMYVLANLPFPDAEYYDDFSQIENGVGLIKRFEIEFFDALLQIDKGTAQDKSYTLVTGEAAFLWLEGIAKKAMEHTGANIQVLSVKNDFFAGHVDVAGLVVGKDIARQLKSKIQGDTVVIPKCMLRADTQIFLDDYTVTELTQALNKPIEVVDIDGYELVKLLTGIDTTY